MLEYGTLKVKYLYLTKGSRELVISPILNPNADHANLNRFNLS